MIEKRHPGLVSAARSVLIVVDMQGPFLDVMHGQEALEKNVLLLCHTAHLLGVPVLATTQNVARLGGTVPAVLEAFGADTPVFDKMTFSCFGSAPFREALAATGRKQVVLCGLETHICISQTAHDLLYAGFDVHVAPDAVSSRTIERHKLGMERIRDAGIKPICAEAAVYEWLERAGTPEFKAILPLVK